MGDVEIPFWLKGLPLAPEYHPTETEFADPIAYISKIEKEASAFGICKVIPPLPKPSKKYVLSNLNKSLAKCPELGAEVTGCLTSQKGFGDGGNDVEVRAVFTTRQQELGLCSKRIKGPMPTQQMAVQKQVWQSGEVYTLDQFESKSKVFARSHLSGVKEVSPMVIESLFWKATSEKPIYVEYANDVPGSGFGEPEVSFRYIHKRKRRRGRFDQKRQESIIREKHRNINNTPCTREGLSSSSTSLSEETSRPLRQKSAALADGSDKEGTAGWKISNSPWNLQVIARSRGSLTRFMSDDIPGVTSPMIYIGMLFSWFAWHVEDHELHSLNFLHTGAPKTWYAIPGDYAFTLEEVVRVKGYGAHLDRLAALALLGEKTTLLSPEVVVASGIPCCRLVQYPGEFVVTFPRAYHVGFSHGFNCGEAANFATSQWLKVAKEAAVRRAAMNYLPMLSHQQLLYMLTMSFVSRVPRSLLPGVRSSRLSDRKKEEREILVKKSFLDDMVTENHRLSILLQKSSTTYAVLWDPDLLPLQTTISTTFPLPASVEAPGLLVEVKPIAYGEDGSYRGDGLHDSNNNVTNSLSGKLSSLDSQKDDGYDDKSDSFGPCMEAMDFTDADDDDLPCGLHVDSGTLACVACGMLGYPFMSIIQPSERASKQLLNGESEGIQSALGNMESVKLPLPSDVVYNECEVLQAAQQNMESVQPPYTDVNGILQDSDSDDGKTINVEFEAQSEQGENQSGDLSPRRIGHACAVEVPNAGRNSKLVENGPLECTSATNTTMPDAIADEEPKLSKECHLMRVSCNNVLNQCSLLCENCVSPVPGFSQISVSQPIPFANNGGHENFQPNPITNNAKQNDAQIDGSDGVYFSDGLVESRGDRHEKVDARAEKDLKSRSAFGIEPYHKTEDLHGVPSLKHGDLVNRLWNTSNVFLRPRTFCLEHALEVEELLQCEGGANVLIICHSDYPKIKAQAPFIAEQIGVDFNFKDIPMENASQAELELINFSIDDDTEECTEDWTTKLGLNLRHCVKLRKLSPSKQEKHKLVLGGLFTEQVLASNFSTLKWLSRKSRTHHKGTGLSRFKLQATPQRKKHDDKLVCHSDGMVLMEEQDLDSFSEPRTVAQACSSRGRGRPKKDPPKIAGSGNDTRNSEEGDLDNNGSKHVLCQPAYSNEKIGNDSPKVADDPTPKSSELPLDILATRETKLISDTYESSMVPVSHTTDMLVEVSEIEQQIQTPGWTTMGGVVCFSERSAGIPDIAISEVSSTEEPKMVDEIGDPTSCVDTPAVESSKTDHRIWSLDETTVEGKVCDVASICTATNSEILEEIHTTEETPVMNEACDSAKFRNPPAIVDAASGSFKMQQDIETTEGTAATRKSFDSLPLTDEDTVITLMAGHSDMQPEIQTADEASKSDTHNSVKSDLPTADVTMGGNFEMTLDVQTASKEDGTMCEVHNSSKSGGLFPMSIAMVGTTEMQKDTQKMDEREVAGIAFFPKGGEDRANSKPVLVYSRLGKDRHKRKRIFDEKERGQESYVGFTRSPCEGLRPRTQRNIDEGMEATVAVEQNKQSKKSKKMASSSVGRKDDEKRKGFYACDLDGCRMSFWTKVDLNLHKQNRCTHKGCKRRFSSHKYAMRHQRVHDDDRPLKCPWNDCGMSFKWAWARTEHMRLHTGERPYQCKVEGCGLTFRFVSDFSRHRRKTGHYVS